MLPFRLVYHQGYDLNFGDHVFPSWKYRLIVESLLAEGIASEEDFVTPQPAPEEDLLLVHEPGWVKKLKTGTLSYREIMKLEVPYSRQMVRAFWLAAGGTTLAARLALQHGVGFSIGGGFHHAFPDHGEGFCAINDIAVAVRALQRDGAVHRAMVIDCDVHQGNGTAHIFAVDNKVFTISIHQHKNYPSEKPPSDVDINLPDGTSDDSYLSLLALEAHAALESFRPQLLIYVAGADPYVNDQLGGLGLSIEGLMKRDHLVVEAALRRGTAVAVVLAGGYAVNIEDTVRIHVNSVKAAAQAHHEALWIPMRPTAGLSEVFW